MLVAVSFFDALFANAIGPEALLSVWSLPSKLSSFHANIESAADEAARLDAAGADVYFGVGLRRPGLAANQRGTASDVVAITCIWADVDYGEHDSGKSYPKDEAEALAWLDDLPVKPSIVVNSGHGLHCYWCLSEPITDQGEAARTVKAWGTYLQTHARERHGWGLDSTWDLPRVLRVPGTTNRKDAENHAPVAIVRMPENPPWIHLADLMDLANMVQEAPGSPLLDAMTSDPATGGGKSAGVIALVPGADPPIDKLAVLITNDPRFAATYRGDRADLKDRSPSGYDLALADACVAAGWTDQEIANLLIARRRQRGEKPEKALRTKYIGTVLSKARTTERAEVHDRAVLAELKEAADSPPERPETPEAHAEVLSQINHVWRLNVERFTRHGDSEPQIVAYRGDGRVIVFPTFGMLRDQNKAHDLLARASNYYPRRLNDEQWRGLVNKILAIATASDDPEFEPHGVVRYWLATYLASHEPHGLVEADPWWTGLENYEPFVRGGELFISVGALHEHVTRMVERGIRKADVRTVLRQAGSDTRPFSHSFDGQVVSRNYWPLPGDVWRGVEKLETAPHIGK